jgi:hypothetical protein
MPLREKYSELITVAYAAGVVDLQVKEQQGRLYLSGVAPSEKVRQKLLELHDKLDGQSDDIILNIKVEQTAG